MHVCESCECHANEWAEPIPDVTDKMAPTKAGDIAAYSLLGLGSLFLGGELGFVSGTASAARSISKDPEARARIETAFRRFRADALRKEADRLDGGEKIMDKIF